MAGLSQNPPASRFLVMHPVFLRNISRIGNHIINRRDLIRLHLLLDLPDQRRMPPVQAAEQLSRRCLISRLNLLQFLQSQTQRFLAIYVLSGAQRLNNKSGMAAVLCGDCDQINLRISQNLLVILGCILNPHLLRPGGRLIIHKRVCKRLDLCVSHLRADTLHMNSSDSSCSDNTYCNHNFCSPF